MKRKPDPADVLGVIGGLSVAGGVALFSVGAGIVTLGVLMILAAWMIS